MNLEEAKANIGKEVIYIGKDRTLIDDVFKGKKLLIAYPTRSMNENVLIEYDELCFWNIPPQDLKLKEQQMNYKIKVTPKTSAEVQELFFELGGIHGNGESHAIVVPSIYGIALFDGLINFIFNKVALKKENIQEITLPQLRDLVVLKRSDASDATHIQKNDESNKYYVGDSVYNFNGVWVKTTISKSDISGCLKSISNKDKEMTWEDALRAMADGKEVERLIGDEWFAMGNFSNDKFRLKPQTIHIDGGEYTKEEWLKILKEFE